MSVALPIEEDPRFRRYTASAGQTVFSIPFPFQQAEDVSVQLYKNKKYEEINRTTFKIVGEMHPEGGTIVFNEGRSSGDIIIVVGAAILDRLASITRDGRFSSKLTDDELDRNRIIQQELQRELIRSLKVPFGEPGLSFEARGPSLLLHVDATGKIIESETPINEKTQRENGDKAVASLIGQAGPIEVPFYDTMLSLSMANVKPTINTVQTGGYASSDDGGGGLYYRKTSVENDVVGDCTSNDGSVRWGVVRTGLLNVKQLGVMGADHVDVTDLLQAVWNLGGQVFMPDGIYIVSSALGIPSNTHISGESKEKTIIKTSPSADKVHHTVTTSNALSIDARLASDENYTTLINGYVENSSLRNLTVDANTYNRTDDVYRDRERGTGIELVSSRHVTVENVKIINGPQHCLNCRAATNSYKKGLSYVAPWPSQFIRWIDCDAYEPQFDDNITTHDSEYIWIERCTATVDGNLDPFRPANSNGIEIDDGSRYVWVTDCYSRGGFGGYQAKGHENTARAHHVWFKNITAENNQQPITISAVGDHVTDPEIIEGTCHSISIDGLTIINAYPFSNVSDWANQVYFLHLLGTRHVSIENVRIIGFTATMPNESSAPSRSIIRCRGTNAYVSMNNISFKDVSLRSGLSVGLFNVEGNSTRLSITGVKVDKYTAAPIINQTGSGLYCRYDHITLQEGSALHAVVSVAGVGGGTLDVQNIRGTGSLSPCLISGIPCESIHKSDYNYRALVGESVFNYVKVGLANAAVGSMVGSSIGTRYSYYVNGNAYNIGSISATMDTGSVVESSGTSRLALSVRDGSSQSLVTKAFVGATALYPSVDNDYNLGSAGRRYSQVFSATGAINTSDARDKDWRGSLNEAELRVAKRLSSLIGIYRWNDAISIKGDNARLHAGILAQEVISVFHAEGLDAFSYGVVCHDEWDNEYEITPPVLDDDDLEISPPQTNLTIPSGERFGIRYDELWAFILIGLSTRLDQIDAAAF